MTTSAEPRNALTVKEVAERARVVEATVYRAIDAGKLRATKWNGCWAIAPESVAEWLDSMEAIGNRADDARVRYRALADEYHRLRTEALKNLAIAAQSYLDDYAFMTEHPERAAKEDAASWQALHEAAFSNCLDGLAAARVVRHKLTQAADECSEAIGAERAHKKAIWSDVGDAIDELDNSVAPAQ